MMPGNETGRRLRESTSKTAAEALAYRAVHAFFDADKLAAVTQSLFARVTRFPRSSTIDLHENRLTEVTAAVLERVDGLAQRMVINLLNNATAAADDAAGLAHAAPPEVLTQRETEADRLRAALDAARSLDRPRVRIKTQVTTLHGRFVDLEICLRPRRPADDAPDLLVWVESKQGSDIHGTQLDVYLDDIEARPAIHKVVLLLVPRRQEIAMKVPWRVPRVDWEAVAGTTAELLRSRDLAPRQSWLLHEYAAYLREEGLMAPDALTASHAISLMEMDDADAAIAGICEHAEAWVRKNWGPPKDWQQVLGASSAHAFGGKYWASYRPHKGEGNQKAPTWLTGWFDWGVGRTSGWQYTEQNTVRARHGGRSTGSRMASR